MKTIGILTIGGDAPGMNDDISAKFMELIEGTKV